MVNDVSIAAGIITVFVLLGVILPYVQADFETSETSFNVSTNVNEISDDISDNVGNDPNSIGALKIVKSIAKMFFWTFGTLPFWLDAIFVVFRIVLIGILVKYIPFIGAG